MTRPHRAAPRSSTPTVVGRVGWLRPTFIAWIVALAALFGGPTVAAHARSQVEPIARAASVCADYPNQAAAQRAADTRDGDGDGIYCESLPCPCLKSGSPSTPAPAPTSTDKPGCTRPKGVQPISFSATKYPNIKRHTERAIAKGWPSILVLNRPGSDARRERLLRSWNTRPGYDRDEYPPAVGRGRGKG